MINLYYRNGQILVFSIDDWVILRKKHRVVGEIVGNTNFIPSLPLQLSPEEALLLMKNNIAVLKEINDVNCDEDAEKEKQTEYEAELLKFQVAEYKKNRKIQLESMLGSIVEQRRKVNDTRSPEEILNEELEKSTVITPKNMIWPILLSSALPENDFKVLEAEYILNLTTTLRFEVYNDLHVRGYYLTGGRKFGGDFLVYFGDPVCHHAIFIVKCVDKEQVIMPSELVAFGRLGTSVRKRAVLASLVEGEVSYVTINWIDA